MKPPEKTTLFGKRLKLARQKEGLSLDELVNKIDKKVSKQALSKYERGEMMPSSDVLGLLIDALNTTLGFLFSSPVTKIQRLNILHTSYVKDMW